MFEVLAELTETGPSLAEFPKVWAAYERLTTLLERTVGRLNDSGDYGLDGCVTMPSWLRHHCSMSHRDAKALTTRGTFLSRHPIIADAAENGQLSLGHVTAIRRNITPVVAPLFDDAQQTNLVDAIAPLPVHDAEHACKVWRDRAEALADLPEPREPPAASETRPRRRRHPPRNLLARPGSSDRTRNRARHRRPLRRSRRRPHHAERQADALHEIYAFYNANHDRNGTPRHRPHVELVYRYDNPPTDGGCCTGPTAARVGRRRSMVNRSRTTPPARSCATRSSAASSPDPPPGSTTAAKSESSPSRCSGPSPSVMAAAATPAATASRLVRWTPHRPLGGRRHHRPTQPRAALRPSPPPDPQTRLDPPHGPRRRHRHRHHPLRPHPHQPTPRPQPKLTPCEPSAPATSPTTSEGPRPTSTPAPRSITLFPVEVGGALLYEGDPGLVGVGVALDPAGCSPARCGIRRGATSIRPGWPTPWPGERRSGSSPRIFAASASAIVEQLAWFDDVLDAAPSINLLGGDVLAGEEHPLGQECPGPVVGRGGHRRAHRR